jgi:hypothetical protein
MTSTQHKNRSAHPFTRMEHHDHHGFKSTDRMAVLSKNDGRFTSLTPWAPFVSVSESSWSGPCSICATLCEIRSLGACVRTVFAAMGYFGTGDTIQRQLGERTRSSQFMRPVSLTRESPIDSRRFSRGTPLTYRSHSPICSRRSMLACSFPLCSCDHEPTSPVQLSPGCPSAETLRDMRKTPSARLANLDRLPSLPSPVCGDTASSGSGLDGELNFVAMLRTPGLSSCTHVESMKTRLKIPLRVEQAVAQACRPCVMPRTLYRASHTAHLCWGHIVLPAPIGCELWWLRCGCVVIKHPATAALTFWHSCSHWTDRGLAQEAAHSSACNVQVIVDQ